MVDLNSVLTPSSRRELNQAFDISNGGQITGYGTYFGQTRAFLLAPEWETSVEPRSDQLGAFGMFRSAARRRFAMQ